MELVKFQTIRRKTVVHDGGQVSALGTSGPAPSKLDSATVRPQGYTVAAIRKGDHLTTHVDTGFLWKLAALDAAAAKAGQSVAKLLEGGAAV